MAMPATLTGVSALTGNQQTSNRVGRSFASLAGAVLLLGIADSMVGSYLVLFASDQVHLTPVQIGLFVSAPAAGGIVVSAVVGRRFDRRPTKGYAIAAAALSALGLVLLTTTTSFPLLVAIAITLIAAGSAAFPQLFTLARVVLGDGPAGQRSAPLLRSGWSLAWALGPLAGAALLPRTGFTGILWSAAAILVLSALVAATVPAPPVSGATDEPAPPQRQAATAVRPRILALLVASVVLFFLAMFAGSVALPLYVTRGLHQSDTTVGLLYSACAAVEVLAALALAALPRQVSQRALIAAAMGALAAYFAVTVIAHGVALLLVGQIARGIAIAVVGAAGIRYFQDLLHPATGRATTLFSNASTAGSLLAGVLAGLSVQHWGYLTTLVLCGVTALTGTAAFCLATRHHAERQQRGKGDDPTSAAD
jgi:MFS transporter, SET family, sugar efflux transporter